MTKKVLISLEDIENMFNGLKLELLSRNVNPGLMLKLILTYDSLTNVYKKWFDAQHDAALSKMETTGAKDSHISHIERQIDSVSGLKLYDEWYDAGKCLPIMRKIVIVEYKNGDNVIQNEATLEYDKYCMRLPVFMVNNINDQKSPPVVYLETTGICKWKYADE